MKFSVFFIVLSIFCLSVTPAFAGNALTEKNLGLRRIGYDELSSIYSNIKKNQKYNSLYEPSYKLRANDILSVKLWGKIEADYELKVKDDGYILVPLIGKIAVAGLTLAEAKRAIDASLDKNYSNVSSDVTLVSAHNIKIYVLGNLKNPGPYIVNPFSKLIEGLAASGGPGENGSLIDIKLIRGNAEIVSFNLYNFLFKMNRDENVTLQDGDIIYIPVTKNLVTVKGDVNRPGIYEVADNILLDMAINAAGGISMPQFEKKITILRLKSDPGANFIFKEISLPARGDIQAEDNIKIENGDIVIIGNNSGYNSTTRNDTLRRVYISGEVNAPGEYILREHETLPSLLKRVGGLTGRAFVKGAVLTRKSIKREQKAITDGLITVQEKAILEEEARLAKAALMTKDEKNIQLKVLEYERIALSHMRLRLPSGRIIIDLENIINNESDFYLEGDDALYIPAVPDYVLLTGAVYNPISVAFINGKPMQYYLDSVGGPNKFADKDDIYIIKANGSVLSKSTGYGIIEQGDIIVVPEKIK